MSETSGQFAASPASVPPKTHPLPRFDRVAYFLRRWPSIHRVGKWIRRSVWAGLVDGFWEFVRVAFANNTHFGPPARLFSAYQALRCGWPPLRGRIILHDQGVPHVAPDSMLALSGLDQHAEQPWPVFWSEHPHARLVSRSLAHVGEKKELCVESVFGYKRWRGDFAARYLRLPPPVRLSGNWTSLVSYWTPNDPVPPVYGHWLHDALPRLALLPEFPSDTRIIVPPRLAPYQRETLELLGLWDRCRLTPETHLEVESYFFSAPTSMITCYNPYSVEFLRKSFLPKRDSGYKGPRKFFFHRTGKRRAVENGEEICELFRSRGWDVVRDVELNFAQTVKLFSEAEAICSTLGSNMCNLMFCQPGCTVMQFVLDGWPDGFVDWIAQVVKLDYHTRLVPCGGANMYRIRIEKEMIERSFAEANIPF